MRYWSIGLRAWQPHEHTIIMSLWMPDRIVICHRSCFQQTAIVYWQSSTLHFALRWPRSGALDMWPLFFLSFFLFPSFQLLCYISIRWKLKLCNRNAIGRVLFPLIFGCNSRVSSCPEHVEGAVRIAATTTRWNLLATSGWRTQHKNVRRMYTYTNASRFCTRHTTHEPFSQLNFKLGDWCKSRSWIAWFSIIIQIIWV